MTFKVTLYLPDDLKAAVKRESRRRGCSEAQVVRDAISQSVERPRPRAALIDGAPFAERAEELFMGFGTR